jgi:uncharacterized membrane protein
VKRLESVDLLRGGVMVVMALDHVRDFFGIAVNPTDPATATVPMFFTRWITHICAPTFFLLMGVGAFLGGRTKPAGQLSRYLLLRGIWLIALEIVVVRCLGLQFNVDYRVTMLTVLWALGWSMIVLAGLVRLPATGVGIIGLVTIVAHNLVDGVGASSFGVFAPLWTVLHGPGVIVSNPRFVVFAAYPLIPWIGVAAAGYALGQTFNWPAPRRVALLWRLGLGCAGAFVALRVLNVYGDPVPWAEQLSATRTALSFLNTTKYPPSLLFLLITLGPTLCILAALDGRTPAVARPMLTFGRVPLFYYLVHLSLIHLLAVIVCYLRYGAAHWMFESPRLDQFPFTRPPGWGFSLPVVYLIWAGVVLAMYPLCAAFPSARRVENAKAAKAAKNFV